MITISAAFSEEEQNIGLVGRRDENGTRQIVFDCSDILSEYPSADISCVMQRPCDRNAYLASLEGDDVARTLVLTDADIAVPGVLKIELRAIIGKNQRKSATFTATVAPSLRGQDDRPGNPVPDSLNRIKDELAAAEETRADLVKALDGVDEAVEKANTAAATADTATEAANAAEEKRAAAETQRESDFKAAITASETAQGNAQAAAENAEKAAQNAENATTKADAAEEKREAAEAGRVNAENARVSSEAARAAAETERVNNEEKRQAELTAAIEKAQAAQSGAESAKADAQTAATESATYAENSAAMATDASTSAGNAATSATAAAGSASEAATTKTEVSEMLEVIAQETTAQKLLAKYEEAVALLDKIFKEGIGGGSLNGFSFLVDTDNRWVLSYTNPEDETDVQTFIMPTETTGTAIVDTMASINGYLKQMIEGGGTSGT